MRIVTKNLQTRILPEPCLHLLRQVVKGGVVIIESGQTRVLLCLADCCCSLENFIGGDLLKEGFGAPRRSRRNKASILSSSLAGLLWQWPTPGLNITQYIHGDWIHEENIAAKADYEVVEDLNLIVWEFWGLPDSEGSARPSSSKMTRPIQGVRGRPRDERFLMMSRRFMVDPAVDNYLAIEENKLKSELWSWPLWPF